MLCAIRGGGVVAFPESLVYSGAVDDSLDPQFG